MYMVNAVCKHARMHVRTVHTIYTQPHMCTDRHTHTHTYTHMHTHRYTYNNFSSHHKHSRKQIFTTKYVLT